MASDYPFLLDAKSTSLKLAFNAYTSALRYSPSSYELTAVGERRRELIRSDSLPSVRQTVVSDLDLRDLYRNIIITSVEDLRGEVGRGAECDWDEVGVVLGEVEKGMKLWLGKVPKEDVEEARGMVERKNYKL